AGRNFGVRANPYGFTLRSAAVDPDYILSVSDLGPVQGGTANLVATLTYVGARRQHDSTHVLNVVTIVDNTGAGKSDPILQPGDFLHTVNAGTFTATFAGTTTGVSIGLSSATASVVPDNHLQYVASFSGDADFRGDVTFSSAVDERKTCVVTHTFVS